MNAAKIQLSQEELQLVQNADWFLTKNKIIEKVYFLFGNLSEEMKRQIQLINLSPEILQTTPKISRGESYKQLPYVMLDSPRLCDAKNVFAVRTFFWWGNYFSITFHAKGIYKEMFINNIKANISLLKKNNFYLCINKDEWQHDVDDAGNYLPLLSINYAEVDKIFAQQNFLKFSAKITFDKFGNFAKNQRCLISRLTWQIKAASKFMFGPVHQLSLFILALCQQQTIRSKKCFEI